MKTQKKGQAAMEFLMSYGWALLVVLIVIASLVYFGMLNPSRFLPDSCTIQGFNCDFVIDTDELQVELTNSLGEDITVTKIECNGTNSTPTHMIIGEKQLFTINYSPDLVVGQRFKHPLKVTYSVSGSQLTHTKRGEIVGKVE
ncbi:hypothetical protein ISS04_01920 [Candidatus Woesearchaeota archaeon]|nr:hypothetical protein [Candidatus Woesearchaeota archaeon]